MNFRAFWLPRGGNSAEEYEDACAGDPSRGRFAIADAATECSMGGLWARLLVDGFVQAADPQLGSWGNWLPPLQERWAREVGGRPLSWYAEIKAQQGAFATFLGLVVDQCGWLWSRRRWRAIAVGDGCLFQVRQGRLLRAFPMKRSKDFSNCPWLVGSRQPAKALVKKEVRAKGGWQPDDRLWLMTDALAKWFLGQHRAAAEAMGSPGGHAGSAGPR